MKLRILELFFEALEKMVEYKGVVGCIPFFCNLPLNKNSKEKWKSSSKNEACVGRVRDID